MFEINHFIYPVHIYILHIHLMHMCVFLYRRFFFYTLEKMQFLANKCINLLNKTLIREDKTK